MRGLTIAGLAAAFVSMAAAASEVQIPGRLALAGSGVRVVCQFPDETVRHVMTVALLERGGRDEVALTAAHGLGGDPRAAARHCVLTAGGERLRLSRVHAGSGRSDAADWAVLVAEGRFDDDTPRFTPARLGPEVRAIPVRVVLDERRQPGCRLAEDSGGYAPRERIRAHTCPSLPGYSGAPVIAQMGGRPYLVGVHLGSVIDLRSGRRAAGRVRVLDAEILGAIATLSG
ncbi:hypothetical protein DDZ18_10930 [Marinicauda salina]|uniref:Serine protease n=2 Tax=Marinicauda salina TaxID=2135793 RepID=A0A2U2BRU6_9PROT|nr:hypothetical protein DDZ18_10930 [Marinicauda salina]